MVQLNQKDMKKGIQREIQKKIQRCGLALMGSTVPESVVCILEEGGFQSELDDSFARGCSKPKHFDLIEPVCLLPFSSPMSG